MYSIVFCNFVLSFKIIIMKTITLEELIKEGTEIKGQISPISVPPNVIMTYSSYRLSDNSKYENWKNMTIRFLSMKFPRDRCISDFEKTSEEFSKKHNSPKVFDNMLGILKSCLIIPQIPNISEGASKIDRSINVNVNQTQSQQQSIASKIFIEAIKDELTGKQLKEIKDILSEKSDSDDKKSNLIDKFKSFGSDVVSNIIANIITNPNIINGLL